MEENGASGDCDMACAGDALNICGGFNALSVYKANEAIVVGETNDLSRPCQTRSSGVCVLYFLEVDEGPGRWRGTKRPDVRKHRSE